MDSMSKYVIENITQSNAKDSIEKLVSIRDSLEDFNGAIFECVSKIVVFEGRTLSDLLPRLLDISKLLENQAAFLFLILGGLAAKRDEPLRLTVLAVLDKTEFGASSVVDLLFKADSAEMVAEALLAFPRLVDECIRMAMQTDNSVVARNFSQVLPKLPIVHFINFNAYAFLFENENYNYRVCFLEIIEMLILHFKQLANIEAVRELSAMAYERLLDVSFYVRVKALHVVATLFRKESILKDQRNGIISELILRAKDKTIAVRKKAISMLREIMMNHPFKHKKDLYREDDAIVESGGDSIYLENKNSDKLTKTVSRVDEDFIEFVKQMENAVAVVVSLFDVDFRTDLAEIASFIKVAYLLNVRGARNALKMLLGLMFSKDREAVVSIFKEIVYVKSDVVYEFIGDKAFDEILRLLEVDEGALYRNFYEGSRTYDSIYIISQLRTKISEANALTLATHTSNVLFASNSVEELGQNIAIYCRMLVVISRPRVRILPNHELIKLISKNVIKMIFYHHEVIGATVRCIYALSQNPDRSCERLLRNIVLSESRIKLLDCIGSIATCEYRLLERLENTFQRSNLGAKDGSVLVAGLAESERLSLREQRKMSETSKRRVSEEARSSSGMRRDSMRMSLRYDELKENMKNKSDEEVADYFFYLREHEVIYSPNSMLSQFLPVVDESVASGIMDIEMVALRTMNRLMLTSSVYFNEKMPVFLSSLRHTSVAVRNNAVAALNDFALLYNSAFDMSVIYSLLDDPDIRKNAVLTIYRLLHRNVIRINGNATKLIKYLDDPIVGGIVHTIVRDCAEDNNMMSVIFYEVFLSELPESSLEFLCEFVAKKIQEPLFAKCLRAGCSISRLRVVYGAFEIGEVFKNEHMFMDEMKQVVGLEAAG